MRSYFAAESQTLMVRSAARGASRTIRPGCVHSHQEPYAIALPPTTQRQRARNGCAFDRWRSKPDPRLSPWYLNSFLSAKIALFHRDRAPLYWPAEMTHQAAGW